MLIWRACPLSLLICLTAVISRKILCLYYVIVQVYKVIIVHVYV